MTSGSEEKFLSPGTERKVLERVGLNSIQGRLTAITFVVIIGTAVTMGIVGFRFTVNFEEERFRDHFNLLASYLASNAELGVLLGNESILQGLTDNMLMVKDVQTVEIFDHSGTIIVHKSCQRPLPELGYVSAPVLSTTMTVTESPFLETGEGGEEVGKVSIGYSLTGLELLKQQLALGFITLSILLAIVAVVFYWRLSHAVRAPLQDILNVAGEVSRGRLDIRTQVGTLQETRTLGEAFNEMLDALQAKRKELKAVHDAMAKQQVFAEVGKFSMIVAHEIKNPLAIIKGSLSVLRKDTPLDPALKTQMVGYIDDEIERINKLVEDFLIFARPGKPAFHSTLVVDLIADLAQRLRLLDRRILVLVDIPEPAMEATLNCDAALLERALFNVVRNALEATGNDSPVQVLISSEEDQLDFSILDEGQGLTPADLDGIFEPFFSTKAKGTGLGLAIAKEVITAHNGTITAANREEGGAVFNLRLPLDGR
ncbi:MAG: ATP-binding protein [Thermodesulfobacteriota bacterium]|nr:ATP-binding protein [Thermodesulfobacteriota bacterium]